MERRRPGCRDGCGAAFFEAVALAFERDHGGVVNEAVDQRSGDHRVAEDLAPGPAAGALSARNRCASSLWGAGHAINRS